MKFTKPLTPLKDVFHIVIHHAEADKASPEDIHAWHLQNGWIGAGYNEYIRKDGSVHIMRGDNVGAHCVGFNNVTYGICLEGNYQNNGNIPKAQWDVLIERVKFHKKRFNATVVPHSLLVKTDCPGKMFPFNNLLLEVERSTEMDIKNPLQTLVNEKIITAPEYWQNAINVVKFLDKLILNMAEYIERNKNGN